VVLTDEYRTMVEKLLAQKTKNMVLRYRISHKIKCEPTTLEFSSAKPESELPDIWHNQFWYFPS